MTARAGDKDAAAGKAGQGGRRAGPAKPDDRAAGKAREILFILGMHRSGTSVLARAAAALGYALPRDAQGPAPDNPHGHCESAAIVAANDAILAVAGGDWRMIAPPDGLAGRSADPACGEGRAMRQATDARALQAALRSGFGQAARIAVKDPRLSLTLPLWRAALAGSASPRAGGGRTARDGTAPISGQAALRPDPCGLIDLRALIALRDPRAVAASLARRDGMPEDLALLLWAGHLVGALTATQGLPRAILPFPGWLHAGPDDLARLLAPAGLAVDSRQAAMAAALADPGLLSAGRPGLAADDHGRQRDRAGLGDWADAVHADLAAAARGGSFPDAAAIERIAGSFAALSAPARAVEAAAAARTRRQAAAAEGSAVAQRRHARAAEAQRDAALAERAVAETGLQATRAALRAAEAQRDAALAERAVAETGLHATRAALRSAEAQRDAALGERAVAETGLHETRAALRSAEAQRDMALDERAVAETGLQGTRAALRAAEAQRDAALAARDAVLAAAAADREAAGEQLAAVRATAAAEAAALRDEIEARVAAAAEAETGEARLRAELASAADAEARLAAALAGADAAVAALSVRLRAEELAVARPLARNLYRLGGRVLRHCLPAPAVEAVKARLPLPAALRSPVPPAAPRGPLLRVPAAAGPAAVRGADIATAVRPRDADRDCPDIFMLSIIAWDFRTQRPQHLARDFARRGHRVFYVEMETDLGGPTLREVEPGLYVLRLGARATGLIPAYTGQPSKAMARRWVAAFEAFAAGIGASPMRHLILQHPYWWPFVRHLPAENRLTFDCMDEISGFSNSLPHVVAAEDDMIRGADRVIVTSDHLARRVGAIRPATTVRNAAAVEHFAQVGMTAADLPGDWTARLGPAGGRLRAGYVGAIAEWFDAALLAATARAAPDIDFHLCGGVTTDEVQLLSGLPNVTLHGEIAYGEVPGFLAAMDVMTIPFRLTPIIRACDPVKFYEYAAAGRPTVATALPELDRAGDLVFRAGDPAGFVAGLRAAAEAARDETHVARLRAYAAANTWADRGRDFLAAMTAAPRVSAVVLAYGDPVLTRATIGSLTAGGGTWPNLEIVLVDNGSPEVVVAEWRAMAAADPRIRLVEMGTNAGFARGNNAGIATATGEFVMLLNNDTYVAPGAIAAMVAHLQADPRVGVVGPLTNAIGNEARVEVAYADMTGMAAEMRRVTAGHRGQRTEVAVCAYFCAMFRAADLARVGPLSEDYGLGMFEDDDHCARIRAGGQVCALAEDAFVHHHLSASFDALGAARKAALFARNRAIFESRWGPWVPHRYRDARPRATLEAA
jgi:GT2 family glycosyltransferase